MEFPDVADGLVPALLTRVDRSAYDVLTPGGALRVPALPPPPDPRDAPTVGDWLALAPVGLAVEEVLPRSSLLVRGTARGTSVGQPLAANVDHVLVCLGLSGPLPLRRLERLLTLAWESGAVPVVVLTKSDLCADVEAAVREVAPHAPGCDVVAVSAATGDLAGLAPYASSTLVLLGASGAGKSTVVNALMGAAVMAVNGIRDADGKGRHTTSHRELLLLPTGGVVIDTPGLRGVALHAADDGLALAFSDVEDLASACKFADCAHVGEPGCAVLASVEGGDLGQDRVDAWRKLQRELAFQARRTDARLRSEESKRWKAISKAQRAHYRGRP
ncbi:MAG TPA: ribosome small subunit-dependent GTPase A [Mycobacteriales bacterium]|nr:ribosome small subunit-dependent GTPase A [Mycobacteriales bacterium]